MKHLIFLLLIVSGCATRQPEDPVIVSAGIVGKPLPLRKLILIDHKHFQVTYDPELRLPLYVSYQLTADQLRKRVAKRKDRFKVDPYLVKNKLPHVKPGEYLRTGYDKGHLAPSADFQYSQEANDLTFVMSNMAPQTGNLNRDAWRRLEDKVREWACGEGKLTVITGIILGDKINRLKNGNLRIPQKFFKTIIDETPPKKAISFIYDQSDKGDVILKRRVEISDIQKLAGISLVDVFPMLKGDTIRKPASLSEWKSSDCD